MSDLSKLRDVVKNEVVKRLYLMNWLKKVNALILKKNRCHYY